MTPVLIAASMVAVIRIPIAIMGLLVAVDAYRCARAESRR